MGEAAEPTVHKCDVVVVGYGFMGQALTSLLSQKGHRVIALERHPALYGQPRMCGMIGDSARVIQAAGDIDFALHDATYMEHYKLLNQDHKELLSFDLGRDLSGFAEITQMYQPDVEDAMDVAARECGAKVYTGWEVDAFEQDDEGVTVHATGKRTEDPDQVMQVRAKYVVGTDGDRSMVRRELGIEQEAWPFHHAWVSIDALRKRELPESVFSGVAPDLRFSVIVCAPNGGTHGAIPIGQRRLRFEILTDDPDAEHDEALSEDVAYQKLEEVYGLTRDDVEIYRQVIYPFKGRLAEKWRKGRVFLAGDAAHVMTPFLGQGGSSGLRDVANLAFKMDLVLRGISGDKLLDTYEEERKPHTRVCIEGSDQLAAMACEADPEKARARDEMFLHGEPPPPPPPPIMETGILHRLPDGAPAPAPVGTPGPQSVVRTRGRQGRFDDVMGRGFQVLGWQFDPREHLSELQQSFLAEVGSIVTQVLSGEAAGRVPEGAVVDLEGFYEKYMEDHGIVGLVLRPDFFVFGVARQPGEVGALIDSLAGQLHLSTSLAPAGA